MAVEDPAMAAHLAVLSLLHGDVDMALAGGESLEVLKRLENAMADGDTVRSVIRDSVVDTGAQVRRVLAETPAKPSEPSRPWQTLVLSARSGPILEESTAELAGFLRDQPEANLGDVAFTLQVGRHVFDHRRTVVCRDPQDAVAVLEGSEAGRLETYAGGGEGRAVSFLLPGFGDHYPDMALGFYRDEPAFRILVDDCCDRLLPELGFDLRGELFPGLAGGSEEAAPIAKLDLRRILSGEGREAPGGRLTRMAAVHPAVFVVEYALAQRLIGWGIRPRAMIGYSLGEYVAACLAGVISLDDYLTLVARRARLIEELPAGAGGATGRSLCRSVAATDPAQPGKRGGFHAFRR